jgi:hypothetical protein
LEDLFVEPIAVVAKPVQAVAAKPMPAEVRPASHVSTPAETANAMRTWTDNTGSYKINAQLVTVGETTVRLLKDTGKYTTVPTTRLSNEDLEFVRRQSATNVAQK